MALMASAAGSRIDGRVEDHGTRRKGRRGGGSGRATARVGLANGWVALPYLLFVAVFLIVPIFANLWNTFFGNGEFSTTAFTAVFQKQFVDSFVLTGELSILTALVGGVLGLLLAWALAFTRHPSWLRRLISSFSALASQSGGVQLAYAFIAAVGTQGVLSRVLDGVLPGMMANFKVTGFWGVALVYLYFQIPLMATLMLPAIGSLKKSWYEAAVSLGATRGQYLRDVALPVLWPAVAGSLLLLFANAFAAYATAYALSGGGLNLVPILIGFYISGNVLMDPSMAASLVTWMMIVIIASMWLRSILIRRSSRWLDD